MLGKETHQYSHRQSSKNTLCKCILERETQETVFGKNEWERHSFLHMLQIAMVTNMF